MNDTIGAAAMGDEGMDAMLDGNAAAGMLMDAFGTEMTPVVSQCAHCGNVAALGTTHAWMDGPGIVLRCAVCREVVLRVAATPTAYVIDARGTVALRLPR